MSESRASLDQTLSVRSAAFPNMPEGLYESLLTEWLHRALAGRPDLHPEIGSVDDGEQPLTIARHLAPVIERALRAATTPQDRADLVRRILAALLGPDPMAETVINASPQCSRHRRGRYRSVQIVSRCTTHLALEGLANETDHVREVLDRFECHLTVAIPPPSEVGHVPGDTARVV